MGTAIHPKPADIVGFVDSSKSQHWIIIESKKPKRQDGVDLLKSYMNPTGATLGIGPWVRRKTLAQLRSKDFSSPFGDCLDAEKHWAI